MKLSTQFQIKENRKKKDLKQINMRRKVKVKD